MTPFMRAIQVCALVLGIACGGCWLIGMGRSSAAETGIAMELLSPVSATGILAWIEIPAIELQAPVREGAEPDTLAVGAGHLKGTALPGGLGNFVIAGHRDSTFRRLKRIGAGMEIDVTSGLHKYRYRVTSTEVVAPAAVSSIEMEDIPTMTLVTCYPFGFIGAAPKRFVVHAMLLSENTVASNLTTVQSTRRKVTAF